MSLSFRLRLKLPNGRQKSVVLKKDTVSIGRDSSCDIKINDPEISRNHACLTLYSIEDMFIKDMGSSNGTYLRNSPITQKTRIAPGAIIRMGNTYLSIEVSGGFSVETFNLPVSDAEYQKFSSIFEPENKSKSSQEQLLLELFDDLIMSDAGIQNLELLLNRIAAFLKAENGLILLDSEGTKGERAVRITRGDKLHIPENIINTIQESGKCIILPSFAMDKNHNQLLNAGTGSAICAPFSKKDSIKGVIYLERSTKKTKFTPEDLKKLCAITRISSQSINQELKTQNLNRKIESLESERKHWFSSIVTKGEPPIPTLNKKYQQLLFVAMRIGKANQHVLLIGEQGTGKTLIAQRIHAFSERKKLPFITLDCMQSPKKILADILFGSNEQNTMIVGLLAQAHESTLFIRELSALPLELQSRLAQKLNKHLFATEDDSQKTARPVRLIATSDIDPVNSTSEHIFHPDLLALIQATIKIPSLSDRPEDILPLAKYFLRTYLPSNRAVMDFAPETAELMIRYSWPNNVTELEDCMRYTAAVCIEQKIHIGDLPKRLRDQPAPAIPDNLNLRDQMGQLETNLIRIALDRNKQIVTRAANDLGLSESTLRYRMQRLKIKI